MPLAREERRMEIIIVGCLVVLFITCIMFCYLFAESETFIAIDEKIAEKIRGERNKE